MGLDATAILAAGLAATDQALDRLLPPSSASPTSIHQAMRHSTFAGGKRLRPILAMEAGRAVHGLSASRRDRTGAAQRSLAPSADSWANSPQVSIPENPAVLYAPAPSPAHPLPAGIEDLGAALEMLHTYSLVHDDLPALDNDDLRRGKPTCHVVFGEAIAILAGDALQTQAYQVLASLACPPEARVEIIRLIAGATGTVEGMIGGQVLDLEGEHTRATAESVHAIHRAKTGALIRVSVVAGGIYSGATREEVERLTEFGSQAGLAFQIVDDILDMTQDSTQLGKTAGKDLASDKATWPAVHGIDLSRRHAHHFIEQAFAALEPWGASADGLRAIAQYLVDRTH